MSISTIDHAPPVIAEARTDASAVVIFVSHSERSGTSTPSPQARATPDPDARSKLAMLLFEITGWLEFRPPTAPEDDPIAAGYAQLAVQYEAEDAERRRIARRRPPAGADEE
jgi:hypothetical protein